MNIEMYKATVKHDKGKAYIHVLSLTGLQGAKDQVMELEGCPECAIIRIEKIETGVKNPKTH